MGRDKASELDSPAMTEIRLGMIFDGWDGCGLGHYARARAIGRELCRAPDLEVHCKLVPLRREEPESHQMGRFPQSDEMDRRHLEGAPIHQIVNDYDLVFLDTYQSHLQNLDWVADLRVSGSPTALCLICDTPWSGLVEERGTSLDCVRVILDGSHCLEQTPMAGYARRYSGPRGVFLNSDILQLEPGQPSERGDKPVVGSLQLPPCVALGESESAKLALDETMFLLRRLWTADNQTCLLMKGSDRFGHVHLRQAGEHGSQGDGETLRLANDERLDLPIGEVFRRSEELAVAAGQMLWEAATQRESLWVVALHDAHVEIMNRLFSNGIFEVLETEESALSLPIWFVRVPRSTASTLRGQQDRVRELLHPLMSSLSAQ